MSVASSEEAAEFQATLRETARAFLADRCPPAVARAIGDGDDDGSALWGAIADLGWAGVELGEDEGGLGAGFPELAILLEECGRAVAPVPLLSTAVLGVGALLAPAGGTAPAADAPPGSAADGAPSAPLTTSARAALLARASAGEAIVTAALTGAAGTPGRIDVVAAPDGTLDGVAAFVPDLERAQAVVVAAVNTRTGQPGAYLVTLPAPGATVEPQPTIDRTRRLARLTLAGVRPEAHLGDAELVDLLADRAALAIAADCVGGAERVLEITLEHLKSREQFGRALGTFQALKHRCSDMFLLLTGARSAVAHAAQAVDRPAERAVAVSIAKSYAAEAYAHIASDGVQLHGAIGFTWEHDIHLFLKRAKLNEALFGDADHHRDRLDSLILPR